MTLNFLRIFSFALIFNLDKINSFSFVIFFCYFLSMHIPIHKISIKNRTGFDFLPVRFLLPEKGSYFTILSKRKPPEELLHGSYAL